VWSLAHPVAEPALSGHILKVGNKVKHLFNWTVNHDAVFKSHGLDIAFPVLITRFT
jgi:hypothetical protein